MTYQHIGNPPPPVQPAPAKKSGIGLGLLLGGIGLAVGLGIGCIGGIAIGGSDDPTTNAAATTKPPAAAAQTTAAPAPPATTTAAVAPAGPATTIDDGTWTVGVDIAAGTYRPVVAAGDRCYWAVKKGGSNGDIIKNDIGGGRPTVVLAAGQEFETNRCGTWQKQ